MGAIKEKPAETQIAEYSQTAAALAELRGKYAGVVFDVSGKKGLAEAKEARAEIRSYRTGLEKERVRIKEPALERCKLIDSEARKLTAELMEIEQPIDEQIKKEERRKEEERIAREKQEMARVGAIQDAILAIRNAPARFAGKPSAQIRAYLAELRTTEVPEEKYAEFIDAAERAKDESVATLELLAQLAQDAEAREAEQRRIDAEREELARLRAEAETRKVEEARQAAEERKRQEAELQAEREHLRAEREAHETEMRARQAEEERTKAEERRKLEEQTAAIAKEREQLDAQRREAQKAEDLAAAERERAEQGRKLELARQADEERVLLALEVLQAEYTSGAIPSLMDALKRAYQMGRNDGHGHLDGGGE